VAQSSLSTKEISITLIQAGSAINVYPTNEQAIKDMRSSQCT